MPRVSILLLLALACGPSQKNIPRVSKEPISVRGWIADIEVPSSPGSYKTVETESARRASLFQSTNVWADDAPYVSGGVAPNGAFILLDVPPGNSTITFSAPGIPAAKLVLQNIPGNADVIIPALVLRQGSVALADPNSVRIRMAAHISKPSPSGATAIVAGARVPVMNTPYNQMTDRHDYPNPPGAPVPLAIVR